MIWVQVPLKKPTVLILLKLLELGENYSWDSPFSWNPFISSNLGRPREMRLPLFACYRFRSCVSMRRWNNNCAAAKRIFKIKHCATYSRLHNNLGPIPSSFLQEASASLRLNIALPTVGCIIVWDQFLQAFCKKQLSWTSKLWPGYT